MDKAHATAPALLKKLTIVLERSSVNGLMLILGFYE